MPMTRGMESSCYVKLAGGATVADLRAKLQARGSVCCTTLCCAAALAGRASAWPGLA